MSENCRRLLPDTSALNRKADAAIRAFWDEAPEWRSLWREVFEEWAAVIVEVKDCERLGAMLWLMADALADASMSVPHSLLAIETRQSGGSPSANAPQRTRRRAIALLAAHKLVEKQTGMTDVDCFKAAAAHARNFGAEITWQQVRAAWQNKESYSPGERAYIEDYHRQLRQGSRANARLARLDDFHAEAVAFYTSSPVSRERRGGPRRR